VLVEGFGSTSPRLSVSDVSLSHHTHHHLSRSHSKYSLDCPTVTVRSRMEAKKLTLTHFRFITIPVTMESTFDDSSRTVDSSVSDCPDSIQPSGEISEGTIIYLLPTLEGSCDIASNEDLSNVDPDKIPQKTLRTIRHFETVCKQTRDKYYPPDDPFLASHPAAKASHDKRYTELIQARALEKLGPALLASNAGLPGEIRHSGVLGGKLYSRMLKPSTCSDRPAEALSMREGATWTDKGRLMETAYNRHLKSLNVEGQSEGVNVKEPQSEALSREDATAEPPTKSVPAVACDVARPLPEESRSIAAQPIASPPQTSNLSPGPSFQSHTPSQNQRIASRASREWETARAVLITVPFWPRGCTNPLVKSTSQSALKIPDVQDTLSLAHRFSQYDKTTHHADFVRQAMNKTLQLGSARIAGIKFVLAPQKGGSSARSRNDADNGTERYCDSVEYQSHHDESTCTQYIDLEDAPGEICTIPDRLLDLELMVRALMAKDVRMSATPA
jgi:hypothetical protein